MLTGVAHCSPKINLEKPNGFKQPIMRRDDMFKNDGFDFLNKVLAMMEQEKKNASNSSSPPGRKNVE